MNLAWMEALKRELPLADKGKIFEELQDLVSDQLKVCCRLCMRIDPCLSILIRCVPASIPANHATTKS